VAGTPSGTNDAFVDFNGAFGDVNESAVVHRKNYGLQLLANQQA
jgi:hypothetical protein